MTSRQISNEKNFGIYDALKKKEKKNSKTIHVPQCSEPVSHNRLERVETCGRRKCPGKKTTTLDDIFLSKSVADYYYY